jgi:hypothetical protein
VKLLQIKAKAEENPCLGERGSIEREFRVETGEIEAYYCWPPEWVVIYFGATV